MKIHAISWCFPTYMGVSLNGGTPQNTPKWSFLVGNPMVVGYPYFWKHLYNFKNDACRMPSIRISDFFERIFFGTEGFEIVWGQLWRILEDKVQSQCLFFKENNFYIPKNHWTFQCQGLLKKEGSLDLWFRRGRFICKISLILCTSIFCFRISTSSSILWTPRGFKYPLVN